MEESVSSNEVLPEERVRDAEYYIKLISNIPCGVAILHWDDGDFCLDFANEGFLDVNWHHDIDVDNHIGRKVMQYVYEPDRGNLEELYKWVSLHEGETGRSEYRVKGDDGVLHWVSLQVRPAYKKDGTQYYYAAYSDLDRQKQTEEKLAESRNNLEESILNTGLQFFTYFPGKARCENYTLNSRFAFLPKVWEHYPEDFLRFTKCPKEDAEKYRGMIRAIDSGADNSECTVRFSYRGKVIWEKISLKAIRDREGRLLRAQGHSIDVTERINAQEKLRKERVRMKTLEGGAFESFSFNVTRLSQPELQTLDDGLAGAEITDEIVNEALGICPEMSGGNPDARDVMFRIASRIPDRGERELFISVCSGKAMREGARQGRYSAEIRYRRYVCDIIRWVQTDAEVLTDPDSGDLIAFYYTKDISGEVIRNLISEEIIEKNYACVSCVDLQSGIFTVVSGTDRELQEMSGRRYPEVVRLAARKFVAEEDNGEYVRDLSLDAIKEALEKQRYYTVYNRRNQKVENMAGHPQRRMKNDIFYLDQHKDTLVLLLTDVTAVFEQEKESREQLETALLAAKQASSAKSSFLSRMSHEIRTPLNAIIGMDTIAAQSAGNPEKVADCIAKIGLSARYLLSLINDILDMSRIESGKMLLKSESFSFPEFIAGVNNIIRPQIRAKGVDYECTVSGEIGDAYIGDEMKLQQVLVNVLGNAVKFTEHGKITLDVSVTGRDRDLEKLRFIVRDTGCGIAEADVNRIFEAFEQVDASTTTVYGGTGLGLAITRNLVNLMGGNISVRSVIAAGSEFTIDIPLTTDEKAQKVSRIQHDTREDVRTFFDFTGKRLLVAEDNELNAEIARTLLEDKNFVVERVPNGRKALEKFIQSPQRYYDAILMDVRMPLMDGLQATAAIRHCDRPDAGTIPIIAMTANAFDEDVEKSRTAGMNAHLSKPIDPGLMYDTLQRLLYGDGS
jgi:signal transduction histidine kinase/PAS domain-containing protein/ActR/RegA family two-component response regulator